MAAYIRQSSHYVRQLSQHGSVYTSVKSLCTSFKSTWQPACCPETRSWCLPASTYRTACGVDHTFRAKKMKQIITFLRKIDPLHILICKWKYNKGVYNDDVVGTLFRGLCCTPDAVVLCLPPDWTNLESAHLYALSRMPWTVGLQTCKRKSPQP